MLTKKQLAHILHIGMFLLLLCCSLVELVGMRSALAADSVQREKLRVGFYYLPGFNEYSDATGKPKGYNNELLQRLQVYGEWQFEFMGYGAGLDGDFDMLERGEIDLIPCISVTKSRAERFIFSKKIIATTSTNIIARNGDFRFTHADMYQHQGLRIGFLKGSYRSETFNKRAAERHMIYTPVYFDTVADMEEALFETKDIDLLLTNSLSHNPKEMVVDQYDFRNMHFVYNKKNTALRDKIDAQLEEMDKANPMWRRDMWGRYLDAGVGMLRLSREEQDYLHKLRMEGRVLKVLTNPRRLPLSNWENGTYKGVLPDVFAEICKRLRLQYEFIPVTNRQEYDKAWLSGEADIILGLYDEYDMKERNAYTLTSPYLNMDMAILYRKENEGKIGTVAVVSIYNEFAKNIMQNSIPQGAQVKIYPTSNACMEAVRKGDVDAALVYTYAAQQEIIKDKRNRLSMKIIPDSNVGICLGIAKKNSHFLASTMQKAALKVKASFVNQYVADHTSFNNNQEVSFVDLLYTNPVLAAEITALLFVIVIIGALAYQRNRTLRIIRGQKKELEDTSNTLMQLQKSMKSGMWQIIFDKNNNALEVNFGSEYREILGLQSEVIFPNTIDALRARIHPDDFSDVSLAYWKALNNIETNETYQVVYRFKNGKDIYRWLKATGRVVPQEDGTRRMIGFSQDITDEYNVDKVTGGLNREGFLSDLELFLGENGIKPGYSILYFNIRSFKALNELWGFDEGDNFLRFYYNLLQKSELKPLKLGRKEDHFFCLVEWQENSLNIIEGLCDISYYVEESLVNLRARCGIYQMTEEMISPAGMLDRAKLAKENITDEYVKPYAIFDEKTKKRYVDVAFAAAEIQTALEEKQFKVFYQPVVETETGKIVSAEALVRWISPTRGFISPGVFIPAMEENGLVSAVDRSVMEQVSALYLRQLSKHKPIVPVSVNLSWMDFYDEKLMEWVLEDVDVKLYPKGLLRAEITESSYAALQNNVGELLEKFKARNIQLLLDDFGTGVSSLDMLTKYSFDILKIDMSFTRSLGKNPKTKSLLQAVIDMCHQMGMKVIAEGVETEEQLDFYKENKCDYIQGYYFYKPLSEEAFENLLVEQERSNSLVDFRKQQEMLPSSYYKAYLYYTSDVMRQKANLATDSILHLISANQGLGCASGFYDEKYSMCFFSILLVQLLGYTIEEFMEVTKGSYLNLVAPEDREHFCNDASMERYYRLIDKQGQECPVKEVRTNVRTSTGEKQWVVSLRKLEKLSPEEIAKIMQTVHVEELDSFTGLYTKNAFFYKVDELLSGDPYLPCTMMILDLDDFKSVNDVCGHMRGDEVLLSLSHILKRVFRDNDIIGRFGGDEFTVLMRGINDKKLAAVRAQQILDKAAEKIYYSKLHRPCTLSIGIKCSDGNMTRSELFESADAALYKAKAEGKNTFRISD